MAPDWEVPSPVLLNCWKHHAGFLRHAVAEAVAGGPAALLPLARSLVVVGTDLMDLYHGPLPPARIADETLERLRNDGHFDAEPFARWVAEVGGFRVLALADGSQWVVRAGESAGRYVHLHPARRGPDTVRVRANTLRTAVLVLAFAGVHRLKPLDPAVVNRARKEFLGLPPVKAASADGEALAAVVALLRENLLGV